MGLKKIFSSQEKRDSNRSSISLSWSSRRSSTTSFQRSNKIIQNERHSISFDNAKQKDTRNSLSSEGTTLSDDEKHTQFISTTRQRRPLSNFYHYDDNATYSSLSLAPDSATTLYTNLESKTLLSNDLSLAQQQLNSQNTNERLKDILSEALAKSTYLESKIKTIMDESKSVIMSLEEKLKVSEQQHESLIQEHRDLAVTHESTTNLLKERKLYRGNLYDSVNELANMLLEYQKQNGDLKKKLAQSRQENEYVQQQYEQEKMQSEKSFIREKLQLEKDKNCDIDQQRVQPRNEEEPEQTTHDAPVLIKRPDRERLSELEKENQTLKERVIEIEQVSKEAAASVMNANERLEQRIQQLEETANMMIQENVALNEEIDLLSKKTKRRAVVDENLQLKAQLNTIGQENLTLAEMVECLQAKLKDLSEQDVSVKQRQEELMQMHTRAQLGLIEYLEGEDDVLYAMSKFKKQLIA